MALEHHLNQEKEYFSSLNGSFKGVKGFDFLPIIGESGSLLSYFAAEFGLENRDYSIRDILKEIEANYAKISAVGKGGLLPLTNLGNFLNMPQIITQKRSYTLFNS